MKGDAVPVPTFDKRVVPVEDALFVYDEANTRFFRLNSSAAAVYRCCDGAASVAEIVALLTSQFPDDSANVQEDVEATVAELQELGLVTER